MPRASANTGHVVEKSLYGGKGLSIIRGLKRTDLAKTWRCAIATRKPAGRVNSEQERAGQARELAIETARLAANTRCQHVLVLDVTGLSPVTDYFVVATGTSPRQMRTVADDIIEFAASQGVKVISRSGYEGESWILLDFVDVIVHLFSPEARLYYDIENLWGDAKRIPWSDQAS